MKTQQTFTDTDKLPIIYGITEELNEWGLQAYAIDGKTGKIIDQHFCSSESFAKSDLGFSQPIFISNPLRRLPPKEHTTAVFNKERHKKYAKKYPKGYKLEWIGFWKNSPKIVELREKTL